MGRKNKNKSEVCKKLFDLLPLNDLLKVWSQTLLRFKYLILLSLYISTDLQIEKFFILKEIWLVEKVLSISSVQCAHTNTHTNFLLVHFANSKTITTKSSLL